MLSKAVEWKLIAENPFRGVRNLNVVKRVERVLDRDEEVKLLAACDLGQREIRVINAKSNAGERVIPMNAAVHSLLCDLAKRSTLPFVFSSNRKPGERLLDLKKGFKTAMRLAEIRTIRFHDLRHTFATRLVRAGVDLVTVSHLLGHPRITMTARYAHALADVKIAAVSKLDLAGFCSAPDSNRTPSSPGVVAESAGNSFAAST